jgi:hypothetical protein
MGKNVINTMVGLFIFVALCLTGCGSGAGGGTADTQTPTGTVVSLASFKSVYLGTSAGTQMSFPLTGSDSQGRAWSGSYTTIADGPMAFEAQNVTKRRSLITLQLAGGTAVSTTTTAYFLVSNESPYKSVSSSGVTFTPNVTFFIPATAKVGDFGSLGTVTGSDGNTATATWTLTAGSNGASILALSSTIKTGTTVTSTEVDSFHLDAAGVPTSIAISATASGITVNLAGNKI